MMDRTKIITFLIALFVASPAAALTIDYPETPDSIEFLFDATSPVVFTMDSIFVFDGTIFTIEFATPGIDLEPDPGTNLLALPDSVYLLTTDSGRTVQITPDFPDSVPEPAPGVLMGTGLLGLFLLGNRKKGDRREYLDFA